MANLDALVNLAAPYGPLRPIEEIVEGLNRIHHRLEAASYDKLHPEIYTQLPPLWTAMLSRAEDFLPQAPLHVLDYGCGTGFEALQTIQHCGPERIASLTLYDLSPEMLAAAEARVKPLMPAARFTCDASQLVAGHERFNVLLTNSLQHHLPDIRKTLRSLCRLLTPDAVWLAGHEPSARFYANAECAQAYARFHRRRFLDPARYWKRLTRLLGAKRGITDFTSEEAVRQGLFKTPPPETVVGRLVDAWVAHSPQEAEVGRGLDYKAQQRELEGDWTLEWVQTYSFMGDQYEARLPARWRELAQELARKYPDDGANFCCIWRRGTRAGAYLVSTPLR